MKALLVDDDDGIRAVLAEVLTMRGHDVTVYADAESAWEALQHEEFMLALMDWHLPGMDGLELCRRMRSLPQGARGEILVVTASMEPRGLAMALDAGADDYLQKPFSLQLLDVRLTIAERRAAERRAREQAEDARWWSEQRYRSLVDTSPDGILLIEAPATIRMANQQAARLLGFQTVDQLVGQDVSAVVAPEDLERTHAYIRQALEQGGVREVTYSIERGIGPPRVIEISASTIPTLAGQPTALTAVIRDVTERRQAEEAARKNQHVQTGLAQLATLANSTLDLGELLPLLCQSAASVFGMTGADIFLLSDPETLTLAASSAGASPGMTVPLATPFFGAALVVRERRPAYTNDIPAQLPPDMPDHVRRMREALPAVRSALAAPLYSGADVVGSLGLLSDQPDYFSDADLPVITQIAHIIGGALRNARLFAHEHETAERLRHIEQWRTAFLRIMAHELRTPLGQVMGFADLLQDEAEGLSARGQRYLANTRTAATKLELVTQRSFDLMQLYADHVRFDWVQVDLRGPVGQAVGAYQAAAQAKGVELHCVTSPVPITVSADPQRLHQALVILLDNAIKFTPAGGAITVTLRDQDEGAEVTVCNSGPGFSDEMRAYIFIEPLEEALSHLHGGPGVSLLMARRIAALHDGQLRLESPEANPCLVLTLPKTGGAKPAQAAG